jgi:hypothetical protein
MPDSHPPAPHTTAHQSAKPTCCRYPLPTALLSHPAALVASAAGDPVRAPAAATPRTVLALLWLWSLLRRPRLRRRPLVLPQLLPLQPPLLLLLPPRLLLLLLLSPLPLLLPAR